MIDETALTRIHPEGEPEILAEEAREEPLAAATSLDTFGGKIQVKWVPEAAVSAFGQMAFFIEFLKTSGLFDGWVNDCPLRYTSRNAPEKRNVLGTILLSVLAGHWRYAHISAIRGAGEHGPGGKRRMAEEASEGQLRALAGRALGVGHRHDRQAALRASAGRNPGLQSGEAGTAVARLSQFFHRQSADRSGRGGAGGESDSLVIRAAGVVGTAGWTGGGEPAGFCARRLRLGNGTGYARS